VAQAARTRFADMPDGQIIRLAEQRQFDLIPGAS
jgi:hypothetical protein